MKTTSMESDDNRAIESDTTAAANYALQILLDPSGEWSSETHTDARKCDADHQLGNSEATM